MLMPKTRIVQHFNRFIGDQSEHTGEIRIWRASLGGRDLASRKIVNDVEIHQQNDKFIEI